MSVCRSCQAPIRWEMTDSGKRIPLDPEPVENGNLRFDDHVHVIVTAYADDPMPRYLSHFATCRDADAWRKKR
jgi:hypothetical protein